jgi:hypothetical protein
VDVLRAEDIYVLYFAKQKKPKNIERHYTPAALARHLVDLVPIKHGERVLDPAAGANRVFLKAFPTRRKLCCEIEKGTDFLTSPYQYDWAITNPPYHLLWAFIEKASCEARKGFGFLVNINGINTLTPKRLELLRQRDFHMRRLHICQVRRWFGRYYFYVFAKQPGSCLVSWDRTPWD